MSSMSGVAPSRTRSNQRSMVLCTASPRTSDPPLGSGRPAPYLNHHLAEQLRKVLAWLGERTSPRVSFLVADVAGGALAPAATGAASGRRENRSKGRPWLWITTGAGGRETRLSDMGGSILAGVDERAQQQGPHVLGFHAVAVPVGS